MRRLEPSQTSPSPKHNRGIRLRAETPAWEKPVAGKFQNVIGFVHFSDKVQNMRKRAKHLKPARKRAETRGNARKRGENARGNAVGMPREPDWNLQKCWQKRRKTSRNSDRNAARDFQSRILSRPWPCREDT